MKEAKGSKCYERVFLSFSPLPESVYPVRPNALVAMSCFSIKCFVDFFRFSSRFISQTSVSADLMYSVGTGWEMHAVSDCLKNIIYHMRDTNTFFFFFKQNPRMALT